MKNKRVIIVHCWDGYPEYCWYPYVKRELEKEGFEVQVPAFPETGEPKLDKWLSVLEQKIGVPDENLYLVGHSVGCITILRYLEGLSHSQRIGGVILVAGFVDDLGFKELKNFFRTDVLLDEIKNKSNHFVAIHSDDDPYVSLKYGDIFKEKLGAKLIIKHKAKHFSGTVDKEDSCLELPEVVESIIDVSK
ncbi:alpha/beta hydrolase [Patescibacteria group bacterium]|nr:alpha/beta hydrolase [Patescibacteria group bacterium]MCG2700283.1 alpha/beta hydrolase [Candidatus Parcubacteria bacterium]